MNPEEGELRPQLLDRLPLSVGVERISSVPDRIEVVKRNIEFEKDPERFNEMCKTAQEELKSKIVHAREVLPKVEMPEHLLGAVCKACAELKVDGMRPDIVISKAASTLAAFEDRTSVSIDDILVAAELALSHRTREGGFLEPATTDEIKQTFVSKAKEARAEEKPGPKPEVEEREGKKFKAFIWPRKTEKPKEKDRAEEKKKSDYTPKRFGKAIFTLDEMLKGKLSFGRKSWDLPSDARVLRGNFGPAAREAKLTEGTPLLDKVRGSLLKPFDFFLGVKRPLAGVGVGVSVGKRAETVSALHRGRASGWRFPRGKPRDIHLPATIRAAALEQRHRGRPSETAIQILPGDVREKS